MQVGLLMAHAAAIGLTVVILRAALHRWRMPRTDWRMWSATLLAWTIPSFVWQLTAGESGTRTLPLLAAILVAIGLAAAAGRLAARYRHGSQAFRLTLLTLPMIAPAFAFYPTVVQLARDAKEDFVEARYAPQVRNLRQNVQMQVQQSLSQIDAIPELVDLITTKVTPGSEMLTDRAFQVWQIDRARHLPDYLIDRTLRSRRQARESIRLQSSGRSHGATDVRGAIVRLGSLRRGRAVLRRGASRPSCRTRVLLERPEARGRSAPSSCMRFPTTTATFLSSLREIRTSSCCCRPIVCNEKG